MEERGSIVILEDNQERRNAMLVRLTDRFPQFSTNFFHEPAKMIEHLSRSLPQTLVLSLDHDLDLIPQPDGSLFDPGTGLAVADWLATQSPVCPVIIHSTNLPAAKTMKSRLQSAGWNARRITPYDDLAWIDAEWFASVRRILLRSSDKAEKSRRISLPEATSAY